MCNFLLRHLPLFQVSFFVWVTLNLHFRTHIMKMRDWKEDLINKISIVEMVISAVIGWGSMYAFIKQRTRQDSEWSIRLITFIHATIISLLSFLDWLYINKWDMETIGAPNTRFQEALICLTLGYFIFDLMWIVNYRTEGSTMYFHHVCSIVCLTFILFRETNATEVIVGISGLEITNPCLQTRWFLRTYGYQGDTIYMITEFTFMFSFLIFRIYFGTHLSCILFFHPNTPMVLKAGTCSLYIISWIFVFQMISYAVRKYMKPPKMDQIQ